MKTMLLIFSLCCLFGSAQASKVITGIVYDDSDKLPIPGVSVIEKGTSKGAITDMDGKFSITVADENAVIVVSFIGYQSEEVKVKEASDFKIYLTLDVISLDEVVAIGYGVQKKRMVTGAISSTSPRRPRRRGAKSKNAESIKIRRVSSYNTQQAYYAPPQAIIPSNEDYATVNENKFQDPKESPLSTFSVDVDRASYANVRRFINQGSLPPAGAVRIEEMINYFNYNYEGPADKHPFAIHHEVAYCPWNTEHYLLKVALQGKRIEKENLPASNLVFLLDVSGSMNASNKLPLLKSALKMLVNELREEDRVSIVVYAGAAGVVLEPTSGKNKSTIVNALDQLSAGGSTAGGAGLQLAYKLANENLLKNGNNRIILATDGDFNVGVSSNSEMEKLITSERDKGIYITVAGFGMGNYKDSKMEIIANKGNGNYFYIDNIQEARKAMVEEFGGTLYTIAKDVKFQLEFNPMHVAGYRLIGYENRRLNDEDFNDDKKDAGEIGSGHTVTALYEIMPVGAKDVSSYLPKVDELKYQQKKEKKVKKVITTEYSDELLTLKLRYKQPDSDESTLLVETVKNKILASNKVSKDFRFVSSVAAWGMKLRNSDFIKATEYQEIVKWAKSSKANDEEGYKAEMIRLMESAEILSDGLSVRD
ncbi:vWA domain-containing protein [Labilibacter marinus]|uniref:vWA domain-containing protein n=1 Tax=Labilibacter marinus TaxID=1477105 RepID=UPI000837055E|nr:VWA domain-containing protein [Labilibacter marinus]